MLAVPAIPFDSLEYGFEIKWDGIRVLAAVETVGWRLWGRQHADYTDRYPELEILRRLPAGTLVEGELVAVDAEGRPDLARLLRRHGLTAGWKIGLARRTCPVQPAASNAPGDRAGRTASGGMSPTFGPPLPPMPPP
jgi:bifunctional non-homologous end joining protein LigD